MQYLRTVLEITIYSILKSTFPLKILAGTIERQQDLVDNNI
jgi:hypothetical protein